MKRKVFSLLYCAMLLLTAIFTSCKTVVPIPTPVDGTAPAAIGDILLNDGTYVAFASITPEQKVKAVAVICGFCENGKILGLGLKQSESKLAWALSDTGNNTIFTEIVCTPSSSAPDATADIATFEGDTDGSDNWRKICEKDSNAATNYPCFDWVNNYGTTYSLPAGYKDDWYIPSIYELTEYIYKNRDVLNQALTTLGETFATPLNITRNDAYWSSSQSCSGSNNLTWKLYFGDSVLIQDYKDSVNWGRCIRFF